MEQRNREIARTVLREGEKQAEDKLGIKERIGTEKWREERKRDGNYKDNDEGKKERWKKNVRGKERERERTWARVPRVWRSKCVWEASNFSLYPSGSIRAVAFPLSTPIFIARSLNTLPGIARQNYLRHKRSETKSPLLLASIIFVPGLFHRSTCLNRVVGAAGWGERRCLASPQNDHNDIPLSKRENPLRDKRTKFSIEMLTGYSWFCSIRDRKIKLE